MEAVAKARLEGDAHYAPGNWMEGDKAFFIDCLSHAIEHLIDAVFDDEESLETHLGHSACNIAFILWAMKRGIVAREDFRHAAEILT